MKIIKTAMGPKSVQEIVDRADQLVTTVDASLKEERGKGLSEYARKDMKGLQFAKASLMELKLMSDYVKIHFGGIPELVNVIASSLDPSSANFEEAKELIQSVNGLEGRINELAKFSGDAFEYSNINL